MYYREAGQFKTTYAADSRIFTIRQDRIGMLLLGIVALVLVPLSTESGEGLEERVGESALVERHAELADGMLRARVLHGEHDHGGRQNGILAVVAHEIAHVRRRHVAEGMLRELGVGAVRRADQR